MGVALVSISANYCIKTEHFYKKFFLKLLAAMLFGNWHNFQ